MVRGCLMVPWLVILYAVSRVLRLAAAAGEHKCALAALALRYKDWPIDLDTPFQPYIMQYTATIDFSMQSFSINVRPDTGCEASKVPEEPISVDIGGTQEVVVFARHPETGAQQEYTVTVSRLLGSETELKSLEVEGGVIRPVFDPKIRTYQVHLDTSYDEVRIMYRLCDNEQRIRSSAQEQHPTGQEEGSLTVEPAQADNGTNKTGSIGEGRDGASSADSSRSGGQGGRRLGTSVQGLPAVRGTSDPAPARRLGDTVKSGELQLRDASAIFMLDVGFSRTLELIVQCADATQASISTYQLKVARQGCGPKRPYFDPEKKFCVSFCSVGFYRNRDTHRCSHCNKNCKQCTGLLDCTMCFPDTDDYSYAIQPDGRCNANPNHLFKRYRWWCFGLGILLIFLVLMGCMGICQLFCHGVGGTSRMSFMHQKLRTSDSDSDDAPVYPNGRRLAMY